MSKEDKIARNVVTLTFMLVMVVMFLLMSSCSTTVVTEMEVVLSGRLDNGVKLNII